jgi:preprotein translocase subunit SecD
MARAPLSATIVSLLLLAGAIPAAAEAVILFSGKNGKLELGSDGIRRAEPSFDTSSRPIVSIELSQSAATDFAKLTQLHVGFPIDIIICGQTISSPVVMEPIQGGALQLSGNFTVEEATMLAIRLKEGNCTPST